MTAPFRGSGPWRGRGPFLGRGPWAGKAPFGFNAGLPFQISVTGAQLRDALANPSAWGTTGSATGWLLPGLGGARLSGDCRTSVAMQTLADGTVGYAAHNLVAYSEDFNNAVWQKGNATVTSNAGISPVGTLTADLLYPSSSGVYRGVYVQITQAAQVCNDSFYVKASGKSWVQLLGVNGSGSTGVWFNVSAGTIGTQRAGYAGAIESLGNGWYRISVSHPSQANPYVTINVVDADNVETSTANGTDGILLWGAQLNLGPTALPYVPTTTAARYGPAIDWLSGIGAYGIRSEAAATNLLVRSTEFNDAAWTKAGSSVTTVTPNTTIAPDGTLTADTITFGGSLGSDRIYQDTATAAANGTAVAGSVWLWASAPTTVTLHVERTGPSDTESTVCSLTTTPTRFRTNHSTTWTGTTNLRLRIAEKVGGGDIYAWGAQLEVGTEASSPILTYGAAATRAADTLVVLDSGWINQTEGTLAADYVPRVAGTQLIAELDDATANERLSLTNDGIFTVVDGGASQAAVDGGTPTVAALNKVAASYAANAFAVSLNNGAVVTDTAGTLPTVTRMDLNALDGHITRMRYSRRRANDGTLRSLST